MSRGAIRLGEFVPLAASMVALAALSIDAMLPALPAIGGDLGAAGPNDSQLVVSSLMLGFGLGQLLWGPLSDRTGRKPAIQAGLALFVAGCLLSLYAADFATMLVGRVLQGFGVAAPRIVTVALVRDQFAGRDMARVMSFVMAVFVLVPALAPAVGQGILVVAGWRTIFGTILAMAVAVAAWLALRQPETLPRERRIPFSPASLLAGAREVVCNRVSIGCTAAAGCIFAPLIGYLSSVQQVFQGTYGIGARFPAYFAAFALAMGISSIINARLVMRLSMRRIVTSVLAVLTTLSVLFVIMVAATGGVPPLWLFMGYFMFAFFAVGMLFGNLNAMAMEPLGHIAGIGAAVVGALPTAMSVPFGIVIGRAYDGTIYALAIGYAIFSALALAAVLWVERGPRCPTRS